jgi:hypothetical protein
MRLSVAGFAIAASLLLLRPWPVLAQSASSSEASVPRVMQFNGTFRPANGQPPAPVEIVTFAMYADETGGTALWQETQNVTIAKGGEYTVVLGSTNPDGLPMDVFASGQAHWLGVHVDRAGESEQARIRIMSVPYALRSADADTLGGKPASAYVLADPATNTSTTASGKSASTKSDRQATTQGATTQSTTTGWIPVATDSIGGLGNSAMFQNGTFIGVGTTTANDAVHAVVNDPNGNFTGFAAQNLNPGPFAYSGMLFYDHTGALTQFQGYNNVSHEYRINNIARGPGGVFNGSINFMLGGTSRFFVSSNPGIGIGTTNPAGNLDVSNVLTGTTSTTVFVTAGGNNGFGPEITGRKNRVGGSGPTAAQNSDALATFEGSGYATTGFGVGVSGMSVVAQEDFTDTAQGSALRFSTIPLGTNVQVFSMALNPFGMLGVGTVNPVDRLQVVGDIRVGTSGTNGCVKNFGGTGIIGTCSSDRRLKRDITPFSPVLNQLTALQPVHYFWRAAEFPERHFGDAQAYGLIAQDVETVLPELVVTDEDGFKAVDYSKLPLLTIQAVKELKQENDRVRLRNEQLSEEALALGARVDVLERTVRELLAAIAAK